MADRIARVVLQAVVTQYRQAMKDAAKDTEDLGKKAKQSADRTHQSMQVVGKGLMIGGAAALAGFGVAVKAAAGFEKQMSGVKAVANATSGEMKQLADAALKAGADTAFSASDAAKAEAELAKAGIAVKDILGGALTGSLSLAAAGQLELADAATISAQAMNIFKLEGKDAEHIADVLAAGANKSAADVKQLGDALRQGGLVASQTGLSLEETTGALAAFADNALIGSDAGTSLKTMLQRLTPQSGEAAAKMEELGITAYDAQGNFVGLEKFAGVLRQGLGKLTTEQKQSALATIFGSDAVRAAAILYDQGEQGIRDYVAAVNDQGAAARMAATQMDNLSGDLEELSGSIETALISSGSGANKVLREVVQTATSAVNVFNQLPGPVKQVGSGLVAVGGAVALLGGAAMVGVGQVAKFKTSLDTLGVSATTTNRSVRALSLSMRALGIAGTAVVAVGILDHLTDLATKAPKLNQLGEDLVDFAQGTKLSGELLRIAGDDMGDLGAKMNAAAANLSGPLRVLKGAFKIGPNHLDIKQARADIEGLDQELTALHGSNPELAARAFDRIAAAARAQGISTKEVTRQFDGYQEALAGTRAQQKAAGGATDGLTGKLDAQTDSSKEAADGLRGLADATRALFDPVFAAQDAIEKQREAQDDLNEARRKHGKASKEYAEAEREVRRATVDAQSAVLALMAGFRDGTVTVAQVKDKIDDFRRAGLISAAQARDWKRDIATLKGEVGELGRQLDTTGSKHPRPTINVKNLDPSMNSLRAMERYLNSLDGRTVSPRVVLSWIGNLPAGTSARDITGKAEGGLVRGPGSGTSDDVPIMASNGEFVVKASQTAKYRPLLEAINGGRPLAAMSGASGSTSIGHQGDRNVTVVYHEAGPASRVDLSRDLARAEFLLGT